MRQARIQPASDLAEAAEVVKEAFLRYREVMKREAPGLLGGVIWIEDGCDFFLFSENAKYTTVLKDTVTYEIDGM